MTARNASPRQAAGRQPRFAVIGAGMSGILAAIQLQNKGLTDFTVYEKAASLGGTWRDNVYPGLCCDVPSRVYAYSFDLKPDWSQRFSPQPEILGYFRQMAQKYGVERHTRYNCEITRAEYRDGRWRLQGSDGTTDEVDFVIAATGVLHHPVYPDIPGRDSFAGSAFHSARWDRSAVLDGRRVGIIGSGSTGCQIVPAIVDRVARLSLFQRTPQWIMAVDNLPFTEAEKQAMRDSPELLRADYESLAQRFLLAFARAVVGDWALLQQIEDGCRAHLENSVKDPALRRKLTPDYKAGCKRMVVSNDFYRAIQRPNAELVTERIERIEPRGVRTRDGVLHELDVLIYATGFNPYAFMRPMQVIGRGGRTLDEAWADTTAAYRAVAVPDFPNFFMLIGPNSPIGNFSLIMIAEMQVDYIFQLIDLVRCGRCRAVVPAAEPTRRFNQALREAMKGTVWLSGCKSWYLDKNGNPATWPWSFEQFVQDMRAPDLRDFELVP